MTTKDRGDLRDEWYGFDLAYVNRPPNIYWIGVVLSAFWLLGYLLTYPSIPTLKTHWQGIGIPGHCQPWTAICEMQRAEEELNEVRGRYLNKIRAMSAVELAEDIEMSEFISRAGRVRFEDNCAGCHGKNGTGIVKSSGMASVLNATTWQHGGDVRSIKASIQNPTVHRFGLAQRNNDSSAKILAVYVGQLGGKGRASGGRGL